MKLPDMQRTKAAIQAYDDFTDSLGDYHPTETIEAEFDRLGEAVGVAFGLDTADRNSMDTCRKLVRPGPKIPGPGFELSFVRRMVQLSETRD